METKTNPGTTTHVVIGPDDVPHYCKGEYAAILYIEDQLANVYDGEEGTPDFIIAKLTHSTTASFDGPVIYKHKERA